MKRALLVVLIIALPALYLTAQDSTLKWYSIEEAVKMAKQNPRPIFVDTYTDWCGWCKKLDKDTFSDPVIANILSTKYYAVKFNAEGKDPVMFQGKKFVNDGSLGRTHQLAYALLQGNPSYPTVVFLTSNGELITPIPGFRTPVQLEPILMYFAGDGWKTQSFDDFLKTFKGKLQ